MRNSDIVFLLLSCLLLKKVVSYQVKEIVVPRQLYVYKEYKDVQIFKFEVPEKVLDLSFNFTSNSSILCGVRNVSVYLKPHSYPAVDLSESKISLHLWMDRENMEKITLQSDMKPSYLNITAPISGNWYMVAFLPDGSNRILQDGLFRRCNTWMQIEVTYNIENDIPIISFTNEERTSQNIKLDLDSTMFFRYFLPTNIWSVIFQVKCLTDNTQCNLKVRNRSKALPLPGTKDLIETECNGNASCELEINLIESGWNYVSIEPLNGSVSIEMLLISNDCDNKSFAYEESDQSLKLVNFDDFLNNSTFQEYNFLDSDNLYWSGLNTSGTLKNESLFDLTISQFGRCWTRHDLWRKTFPGNFAFEYDLKPQNGSIPLFLNISNRNPTILSFGVSSLTDIGGTLSIELAVSPFLNVSSHNISAIACISYGKVSGISTAGGQIECATGYKLQSNSARAQNFADAVSIPYPEAGQWFITLFPFCFLDKQWKLVPCSINETAIIFSVSSASCFNGKCGPSGNCFQYISGGFIFSTCSCTNGNRGWDCSNNDAATPNWQLLLATLLLALSNLAFIPAIALTVWKLYLIEALVYTFVLFFSTFYHVCNQPVYTYCIMPSGVLQFGDFYSAILSFWVTLIAMAKLPQPIVQLLHMIGALIIALGCAYKRTSMLAFALPSTLAIIIMIIAWVWHSHTSKKCFPSRLYLLKSLLPGILLAAVGLVAYTVLQTEDNYFLVHSAWHVVMAITILVIFPSDLYIESKFLL